jgi:hypothetical protein
LDLLNSLFCSLLDLDKHRHHHLRHHLRHDNEHLCAGLLRALVEENEKGQLSLFPKCLDALTWDLLACVWEQDGTEDAASSSSAWKNFPFHRMWQCFGIRSFAGFLEQVRDELMQAAMSCVIDEMQGEMASPLHLPR